MNELIPPFRFSKLCKSVQYKSKYQLKYMPNKKINLTNISVGKTRPLKYSQVI